MLDMSKSVGPFVGVCRDQTISLEGRKFRILVYGAYNACGIIGSEYNGIAVLDEDQKDVLVDCIERADSGYYGPTKAQLAMFEHMTGPAFTFNELRELVNKSDRARRTL